MILPLINNIAFLIALVAVGQLVITRFYNNPRNRQVLLGLLFGGVAILVMVNPVTFATGIIFDGRSIVLAVVGVVGGGLAASIAAVMAAIYRYQLGGVGAPLGVMVVLLSALLGVLARQWLLRLGRPPKPIHYLALGVVVQLMQLVALTQAPGRAGFAFIEQVWWVILLIYPLATMLLCVIFRNYEQQLIDQQALTSAQEAVATAETANRERFHAYFDHSIIGLAITSPKKGWIEVNDAICATLGYTRDELTRMTWTELTYPEDLAPDLVQFNRMLSGEINSYTLDKRFIHKDGHLVDAHMGVSQVRKPDGSADYFVAMVDDISERKKSQRASEAVRNQLQATLDALPDLMFESDCDGRIVSYHTHRSDLLAAPPEAFIGKRMVEFLPPEAAAICQNAINEAAKNGFSNGMTYRLALPQGECWFELSVAPLKVDRKLEPHFIMICRDITERKKTEEDLRESEYRWRFAIEGSGDGLWDWDIPNDHVFYSERWKAILGLENDDIGNSPEVWASHLHPDDKERVFAEVQSHLDGQTPHYASEHRVLCKDGSLKWLLGRGLVIERDENGKPLRMIGTNSDITERKRAEESLQQAATVFGHTREGITITDVNGTILNVNEAFTRITGYSREDAIGQNPRILSSGRQGAEFYKEMWDSLIDQGHWSGEIWNRRKDGEVYAELLSISVIRDEQGVTKQYVAMFSDITAIKAHQSQLEHMAHFDALTNLPNRFLLADRLHQAMAQVKRHDQLLTVVYLDLDGFKTINDHYGRETGDQVLIVLAKRFKEALREGDSLARISGDEFVAVLTDLEDTTASLPLLNRLQAATELPVELGELSLSLSASLGVTFYPQAQDIDGDQLLRQADQAMYQAKVAGKNRYCIFDAAMDSTVRKQHESLARIRLALERQEFVLYYQPKVNMRTGKVIGAEALIRWQHPEDGLLAPATFLPTIEDHPLAVDVGEWVIDTAMHQMEVWRAAGLDLPVSVNIGARQLLQHDFVEHLQCILAKHPQVHPGCIELEVLETSALADMAQASQVIEDCAKIGMRFALDDFGTGYSSLTYLKRLRVNVLKIDQSFVRDMLDDPDDLAILQGIIGLAAAFNREVIAEGVETVEHGTALLRLGCELAQGYGIARPMPPDQLPAWAAIWQPDAAWSAVKNPG
jgi:diguanylate cyclase (GGDEF)-like protein/PAS domain S-box-containing protein